MFLPHGQAGQPVLRLTGLPAYATKTPSRQKRREPRAAPERPGASRGPRNGAPIFTVTIFAPREAGQKFVPSNNKPTAG
jgi:hypothetical protein